MKHLIHSNIFSANTSITVFISISLHVSGQALYIRLNRLEIVKAFAISFENGNINFNTSKYSFTIYIYIYSGLIILLRRCKANCKESKLGA